METILLIWEKKKRKKYNIQITCVSRASPVWQLWMHSSAVLLTGLWWEGGPGAHLRSCVENVQPFSNLHEHFHVFESPVRLNCYACLVYVKASPSFAGLVGMGISATFISCLPQLKFWLLWLKIWVFFCLHTLPRQGEVSFFSRRCDFFVLFFFALDKFILFSNIWCDVSGSFPSIT